MIPVLSPLPAGDNPAAGSDNKSGSRLPQSKAVKAFGSLTAGQSGPDPEFLEPLVVKTSLAIDPVGKFEDLPHQKHGHGNIDQSRHRPALAALALPIKLRYNIDAADQSYRLQKFDTLVLLME